MSNRGGRSNKQPKNGKLLENVSKTISKQLTLQLKEACPAHRQKDLESLVKSGLDEAAMKTKIAEWWDEPVEAEWESVDKKSKKTTTKQGPKKPHGRRSKDTKEKAPRPQQDPPRNAKPHPKKEKEGAAASQEPKQQLPVVAKPQEQAQPEPAPVVTPPPKPVTTAASRNVWATRGSAHLIQAEKPKLVAPVAPPTPQALPPTLPPEPEPLPPTPQRPVPQIPTMEPVAVAPPPPPPSAWAKVEKSPEKKINMGKWETSDNSDVDFGFGVLEDSPKPPPGLTMPPMPPNAVLVAELENKLESTTIQEPPTTNLSASGFSMGIPKATPYGPPPTTTYASRATPMGSHPPMGSPPPGSMNPPPMGGIPPPMGTNPMVGSSNPTTTDSNTSNTPNMPPGMPGVPYGNPMYYQQQQFPHHHLPNMGYMYNPSQFGYNPGFYGGGGGGGGGNDKEKFKNYPSQMHPQQNYGQPGPYHGLGYQQHDFNQRGYPQDPYAMHGHHEDHYKQHNANNSNKPRRNLNPNFQNPQQQQQQGFGGLPDTNTHQAESSWPNNGNWSNNAGASGWHNQGK